MPATPGTLLLIVPPVVLMRRAAPLLLLCCAHGAAAIVNQLGYDAMLQHVVRSGGWIGPVCLRPSAMGDGFGCFTTRDVEEDEIPCRGITEVTSTDFEYASTIGGTVKLLGIAKLDDAVRAAPN